MSDKEHILTKEQLDQLNRLRQDTSNNGREIFQMYALDLLVELHKPDGEQPPPPPECDQYETKDIETGKCRGPMLPLDGREQFHKGASQDPNDWKVVPMRDDPSLYKIVDNDDVNVADKFATQQNAEMFITHYLWLRMKEAKCREQGKKFDPIKNECIDEEQPPPGPEPPVPSGDKIYQDTVPPHYCDEVIDGEKEQGGDRREPQIKCDYNFLNTEATAYIRSHNVNDTLSVKLRGPKHSGIPDSAMCNNIHYINLGNENKKPFGKQSGHTAEYCEWGSPTVHVPDNVWVGIKAIEWNSSDNKSVHFQTWIKNPADGGTWKLAAESVDTGGLGSCSGPAKEPFTTSPCQGVPYPVSIGFRVDGLKGGGDVEFKNLSVREIQPPTGELPEPPNPPDPPNPPQPTTEFPYQVIGEPMQSTQRGPTVRHYRSGKPDDNTIEKNVKNIKFKNYQFVADITNDCEWAHDDTFSMKLGGRHTKEGWLDNGLGIFSGECCIGVEEDHPSTKLCVIRGPKIGDTRGKRFKMACTYFTDQNRTELWTNFGDGWKKQLEGKDVNGFNPNSPEDETQLRIDGFKEKNKPPQIHSAVVTEIAPSTRVGDAILTAVVSTKGNSVNCSDDLD